LQSGDVQRLFAIHNNTPQKMNGIKIAENIPRPMKRINLWVKG